MRNKLIVVIFVVAFLIRFIGTYPGYNNYHSDEPILYGTAVDMIRNGNLDPGRFDYPGVSIYINYILYRTIFIPLGWASYYFYHIPEIIDGTVHIPIASQTAKSILQTYIFGNREINVLTWGRYIAAAFSFGSVILTYLLAKRLFNRDVAILSVIFLAFNFRQVLNSHVNLPDVYNVFFLLLSLLASHNLWKRPSKKSFLIAGICAGLSFSTKYQFFAFLPIGLIYIFNRKLFDLRILLSGLGAAIVFLITNPYFFPRFELATRWISDVSLKYGMGVRKLNLYPLSYYYHFDFGPIGFFLAVAGLVFVLIKFPKKFIFLFSVVFPFFFILNYYSSGGFYTRNYVTITPLLLIFAGFAVWNSYLFIRGQINKGIAKVFLVFFVVISLAIPARNSLINTFYNTKGWNYNKLSKWLLANIADGTVVASHPFDPPTGAPVLERTEFELGGSYSLSEHSDNGAEYALINADWAGNNFYFWMSYGISGIGEFWNKPIDHLRNTFFGLAAEELFRWQVYAATKPWQAPDANLVLAKLPIWPETKMSMMEEFLFDENSDNWRIRGNFEGVKIGSIYDESGGRNLSGAVVLKPTGARFATVRISSSEIPVKAGRLYRVSGYLKTDKLLTASSRDGFLRVDFYKDSSDLEKRGMVATISSRVYDANDWVMKKIVDRAPDEAKYMVVSLQVANPIDATVWLDDLKIEESDEVVADIEQLSPYNKTEIDLDVLYPNSHGNL